MSDPFESPKFAIRATRNSIAEFKVLADAFLEQNRVEGRVEVDPNTRNKIHKAIFKAQPPDRIRDIAHDGVVKLRHALDQATCTAFELVTRHAAPDRLYFPVAANAKDLAGRVRKELPPELHALFCGFESYPTGKGHTNGFNLIPVLSKAAQRKHRVTCGVGATTAPGMRTSWSRVRGTIGHFEWPPKWDVSKSEAILGVTAPDGEISGEFEFRVYIAFHNAGPLDGSEIESALTALSNEVEEIIVAIEAETLKIVRRKWG